MKKLSVMILAALLLCGCAAQPSPVTETCMAMDTVMTFTVYGSREIAAGLQETVTELEKKLSVTDAQSEIAMLNRQGSGEVSPQTADLLRESLELCRRTGGMLDISIYPVVSCWGFTGDTRQIPEEETLRELLPLVDYRKIRLSGDCVTLPAGSAVDLGSVAKGYTGDLLAGQLKKAGVTSACLNLGGNVQTVGGKPDGSPWRIGVQDPQSEGTVGVLELRNQAAVTSGAYQRYFVGEDGKTYGHILDPRTGYPAQTDLLSVTVVGDRGILCDGFSTALFVLGLEKGLALWREAGDFQAVFVLTDGSVVITSGLQDCFTTDRKLTVAE